MTLTVRRLAYALGAEITGVDISKPLDGKSLNDIKAAFLEHYVLVFRGCPLTREQHIAFSRYFGELEKIKAKLDERPAEYPEMTLVISKPKPNGEPATGRYTGQEWHTDHSHLPVAAGASLLRGVEVPQMGGDTAFCNMYRAYDTLSDGMKKLLEGLSGVHMQGRAQIDDSTPERAAESRVRFPAAAHPLVRVHPETGRKVLYVCEQIRLIVGMTAEESKPLIHYLTRHAERPQNVYRHQWRKDDLVMWDNRCLLHMAVGDYDRSQVRHMERTTVIGSPSGYAYNGPLQ